MMRVLTSEIAVRFYGGFAMGCALVVLGATGVLRGIV